MNPVVVLFFLHNTFATLLLGFKFKGRNDPACKNFGLSFILNGIAFAVWSAALLLKTQNLELWVTIGALFFVVSMITFLAAGIQDISAQKRKTILISASILAILLFLVRTFTLQSNPSFSPEGFFFFNPHPIVQILYVFGLALTALPAVDAVASKFSNPAYSRLVRYGFIAEIMGGITLFTSTNITVLTIAGWIMGIVYILLWTSLVFNKKAWTGVN